MDTLISFLNPGGKQAFAAMNAMLDCVLGSKNTPVNSDHHMYSGSNVLNIDNSWVERNLVGQPENENCEPSQKVAKTWDREYNYLHERFPIPVDGQQDTLSSRRVVRSKSPVPYRGKTFDEFDDHHLYSGSNEQTKFDHLSDGLNNNELKLCRGDPGHKYEMHDRDRKHDKSDGNPRGNIVHSREDTRHRTLPERSVSPEREWRKTFNEILPLKVRQTDRHSFSPHSGSSSPRRCNVSQRSFSKEQSWDYNHNRVSRSRSPIFRLSRSRSPAQRNHHRTRKRSCSPGQSYHTERKRSHSPGQSYYSGRMGSFSPENSYQNRKKRSHSPRQSYHGVRERSHSPGHPSYHNGRTGSLPPEKGYQRGRKRSHSPEHRSYHTSASSKTVRKENWAHEGRRSSRGSSVEQCERYNEYHLSDMSRRSHSSDQGYRYRVDRNEKYDSRRKHYRTSKEPYQECSKFEDEREFEDVSDFSDNSDSNDDGFLDTHIDKWFSDFDRSEFSSDLEQSSDRKRKRQKKARTRGNDDETNTKQIKKTADEKTVERSTKSKKAKKAKHKKNHSEKHGIKPKSKPHDELNDKSNRFIQEPSEKTIDKSDHKDLHAKMKKQSTNQKHSKRKKKTDEKIDDCEKHTIQKETSCEMSTKIGQSSDSELSESRRNSSEEKGISDSLMAKGKEKGTVPHTTSKIKETKTPQTRHKRRHLSQTRSTTAKRRRTRSRSRSRSRSPRRSRSRSRSRSSSGSGQPPRKSHIFDELYQLILAPTSG